MTPAAIQASFLVAYKTPLCANKDASKPGWVEVFGIFAGNVNERMSVLSDGSDIVEAVRYRQHKLQRRYPSYTFPFDGFVST